MLNYITEGDPALPRLLIAHGLYGQARNWGRIARGLSDIRHVISVDMRNHGDSPWFDTHSYPEMADDLAEVIADGPCDVLGHSMGGKAAMALALTHPQKLRKLVIADIAPVGYDHDQLQYVRAMKALDLGTLTRRGEAAKAMDISPKVATFLTQSLDVGQKRWMLNLDALEAEMPRILDFPRINAQFTGPTLFLGGEESTYLQADPNSPQRAEIKRLFPRAHIVRIPGAGHWLHAERPEAVTETIRTFLSA